MPTLYYKENGALIGTINDEQLDFMISQLEEESLEDTDYAITPMLLAYFEELNADKGLISLLQEALGDQDVVEVRWSR
jgi:hypothetical protein